MLPQMPEQGKEKIQQMNHNEAEARARAYWFI